MPSNHLILCHPLLLLPSIFPIIRVFSNESALHIRRPKYLSFSFSIGPSSEYSGLISFRMDWLHLLASLMALLWTSTAVPSLSELSSEEQHQADCLVDPFVFLLCHSFDWWLRVIKKPPAMHLTQVLSLGPEDSLEKEMATHSRIVPGKSHGQRSLMGYCPWGHKGVRHDLATKQHAIEWLSKQGKILFPSYLSLHFPHSPVQSEKCSVCPVLPYTLDRMKSTGLCDLVLRCPLTCLSVERLFIFTPTPSQNDGGLGDIFKLAPFDL